MATSTGARLVGRLTGSRRGAPDPDDVQRTLRDAGSDYEWSTADTIGATAADQVSRSVGRVSDSAQQTITGTQKVVVGGGLGAGAIGGGTYVGSKYMDVRDFEARAEEAGDQRDIIEDIMSDDSLTPDQRETLIQQLSEDGVISNPFERDGDGDSSGTIPDLPSLFSTEGVIMLIIVVYAGRAIVRRMG